jgi:hypothetical protein
MHMLVKLHAQPGSLAELFEHSRDRADLDAAIGLGQRAVDEAPPSHPDRAIYLSNLGVLLHRRFEHSGDPASLDAAFDSWQQSSDTPTGIPRVRLTAARQWGAAAAGAGRIPMAAEGYAAAISLMPQVAWHGLDRATRQQILQEWAGLAADAAGCAILDDRLELAVELLEQGRTVLWTQALNLRGDLARLADRAPDLAQQLDSIRAFLASPVPAMPPLPEQAVSMTAANLRQLEAVEQRKRKARQWDEVLARVRALDGLEHFLSATPYPELAAGPTSGPVVIVNASRWGCHALIVPCGGEHPRVKGLPGVTLDAAADQANRLLSALAPAADQLRTPGDRESDRHAVLKVLDWLWDAIAEPVLSELGHTSPSRDGAAWPRVWWCLTGPLAMLPIHAAGRHPRLRDTPAGTDSVLDRVISSYTPTLTALARARQPTSAAPVRQLTVGMPDTPGRPPLPGVLYELDILARHFPPSESSHQLAGPQATRAAVQAAIAAHSWVHLACHATQQHDDPDCSGFALWDGMLTITDLAAQPTHHQELAFLSACETATGSTRHPDEAIHLAAAMQFLGYRHVIASMWTIADRPAPRVADAFYTRLTERGSPEPRHAAEALHQAVRALRLTHPANPLIWAPYIHLGP